tara:strand:- start:4888 stop:5874 length:987 start_codon:yes stop_codon:yes gene_type:complete
MRNVKSGNILVGAFALLIAFVAVTGLWAAFISLTGPLAEELVFEVKKGQGVSVIADKLEESHVISSPLLFKISASMMFADKNMQAGFYKFEKNVSIRDVIKMLARGHTVSYKVTIPEGLRSSEVIEILKKSPHITGDFSLVKLHETDYLLAETYMYKHNEDVQSILLRMKNHMQKVIDEAWEGRAPDLPLKNKEELLILASMIEKETSLDRERAEIAGVFINRLRKNMRLQSDPTVIYGLKNYDGNITRKDLRTKHPYNTYVINGLPKGPIAHPGAASIRAAAQPQETENIYFVADMTGGHVFAKTHEEHKNNVAEYLKRYRKLVLEK